MTREQWEAHLALKGWWGEYLPETRTGATFIIDPMWFISNGLVYVCWHQGTAHANTCGSSEEVTKVPVSRLPDEHFWKIIEYVEAHPEIL